MLVDSHCHLDFACFDHDRQNIIENCEKLSIDTIVVPATQTKTWNKIISLCQQFKTLKPTLGLHPYFIKHFQASDLTLLQQSLSLYREQVVALGEIGLDKSIDVEFNLQMHVFKSQLDIASDFKLPVILHHRRSHNEIIQTLKQLKFSYGGIIHAFSGSLYEALTYQDLGFKLGVGGLITYPRAQKTRQVMSQVPLNLLVLETDAPDMPLAGKQGQRNTPENLPLILTKLATLRTESREEIVFQCRQNVFASLNNIGTV
jgi:TatD DNase family protein